MKIGVTFANLRQSGNLLFSKDSLKYLHIISAKRSLFSLINLTGKVQYFQCILSENIDVIFHCFSTAETTEIIYLRKPYCEISALIPLLWNFFSKSKKNNYKKVLSLKTYKWIQYREI